MICNGNRGNKSMGIELNHKPFIHFYLIDDINDGWMRHDKLIFFLNFLFFVVSNFLGKFLFILLII